MADTTRFDLDQNLTLAGRRQSDFFNDQLTASLFESRLFVCLRKGHLSCSDGMYVWVSRLIVHKMCNWKRNKLNAGIEETSESCDIVAYLYPSVQVLYVSLEMLLNPFNT